jgi:Putative transposase/Transposase zinc-binding domain
VASLAPPYLPRKPTETLLYKIVQQNLETFLAYARQHYEGGLPRYVEQELRAYLACGDFSRGFMRLSCEACGHDLLVAFSCGSRSICPSCTGRRMANTAAFLVDRVVPDVPVRQYVLTLPYELRKLVAFKADVLTAVARIFVESVFASYRARAKRSGVEAPQCGAVNFVQRCGSSVNLHVHYHLVALDGVFARDAHDHVVFRPAPPPTPADLEAIIERTARRTLVWMRRHGYVDDSPLEALSNEPPAQTALDACAAIAMGRGNVTTMPRDGMEEDDDGHGAAKERTSTPALVVERDGFNLHAGVHIEAGDDLGRERLLRYAARPPLSLERLRRLPGGRVAYRLKYVARGQRGKYRVMTGVEFLARLAAITCPPRYPLTRFAGVLAPRSTWRREVVPKPRERRDACAPTRTEQPAPAADKADQRKVSANGAKARDERGRSAALASSPKDSPGSAGTTRPTMRANDVATSAAALGAPLPGDVIQLAPNIISVKHWDRLLGGVLYAVQPRVDWATLLRRSLSVDVLECPRCHGRLRVVAVITERAPVRRILAHLGMPTDAPPVARARDPTDDVGDDDDAPAQLALGLP